MKRHLVFSFFIFEGWEDNFANKVHLAYLGKYHDMYDDAEFIIVCDDVNDTELISSFKKAIVGIGYVNVKFKVDGNTLLREAKPFYDEVASKLDEFDGIVTWGHNKGVSNIYFHHEWLFNWISLMYFGTMGLMEESEEQFFQNYYGGEKYLYGTPLVEGDGENSSWMYSGSFFNMNPASIVKAMKHKGIKIPKLSNRAYAESFPGEMFGKERLGSHNAAFLYNDSSNFYCYSDENWEQAFNIVVNDSIDKFLEMKNEIWNEGIF